MRVIDPAACAPVAWRNGGGVARELAAAGGVPGGEGPPFDWRLSLAGIERDGPFSPLAGVDRVFAPIEGRVSLAFDAPAATGSGAARVAPSRRDVVAVRRTVDADAPPLRFDGEAAPRATLEGGGRCVALNLMVARSRRHGAMRRVALDDGEALDPRWLLTQVREPGYAHACWVDAGALAIGAAIVPARRLVLLEPDDPAPRAIGATRLLEVAIVPVASEPPDDPDDPEEFR